MGFDYVSSDPHLLDSGKSPNTTYSWCLYRTIDREFFDDMIGNKHLYLSTIKIRERNPYHGILASTLR